MAKIGLSKGLENGQKSGKSQGILKRILSGNPVSELENFDKLLPGKLKNLLK